MAPIAETELSSVSKTLLGRVFSKIAPQFFGQSAPFFLWLRHKKSDCTGVQSPKCSFLLSEYKFADDVEQEAGEAVFVDIHICNACHFNNLVDEIKYCTEND